MHGTPPRLLAAAIFVAAAAAPVAEAQAPAEEGVVYDEVVRREIGPARALAPGVAEPPVADFDVDGFREDPAPRPPDTARSASPLARAPLLVPQEFIASRMGARADVASAVPPANVADAYYRESTLGLGFYYGYTTPRYAVDVTARTVSTAPAGEAAAAALVPDGRFPMEMVRGGYIGTINAANVTYVVEISCTQGIDEPDNDDGAGDDDGDIALGEDEAAPPCISQEEIDALYASFLRCETDGSCFRVEDAQ